MSRDQAHTSFLKLWEYSHATRGDQQTALYLFNLSHDPRVLNQCPYLQAVKVTSLLAEVAVFLVFFLTVQCLFIIA